MAKEIERKYLVKATAYRDNCIKLKKIEQGYLNRDPQRTVRVRISDDKAFITVKTQNHGATRDEWEYEIPVSDARCMLDSICMGVIIKQRFIVPAQDGLIWEVDEFIQPEVPTVAEVELSSEDVVPQLPDWIDREVTGAPQYYNSNLG